MWGGKQRKCYKEQGDKNGDVRKVHQHYLKGKIPGNSAVGRKATTPLSKKTQEQRIFSQSMQMSSICVYVNTIDQYIINF